MGWMHDTFRRPEISECYKTQTTHIVRIQQQYYYRSIILLRNNNLI